MVRAVGLEPTRRCHRGILSPLRLPVPPRPLVADQPTSAFCWEVKMRLAGGAVRGDAKIEAKPRPD